MRALIAPLLLAAAVLGTAAPASAAAAPAAPGTGVDSTGAVYSTARVVVPLTFPVIGPTSYTDTFLACRGTGCSRHHLGQDLMGPKMSPLVAACTGTVVTLQRETHVGQGNYLGIACDTGAAAGWSVMYLHVNNDTPGTDDGRGTAQWSFPAGIAVGVRVLQGQLVGWRGDSGDAENVGSHLHFELRKGTGWDGVVYNAIFSLHAAHHLSAPLASGPHPDGTLVRTPLGGFYEIVGGKAYGTSAGVRVANDLPVSQAIGVSWAEMALYPVAGRLPIRTGALVSSGGQTWRVSDGTRFQTVPTAGQTVTPVAASDLAGLTVVTDPGGLVPGELVQVSSRLYEDGGDGELHAVGAIVQRSWGYSPSDAVTAPSELPQMGDPLGLRDGTLVMIHPTGAAIVSDGQVRRLYDQREVKAYGYAGHNRLDVSAAMVAGLPVMDVTATGSSRPW